MTFLTLISQLDAGAYTRNFHYAYWPSSASYLSFINIIRDYEKECEYSLRDISAEWSKIGEKTWEDFILNSSQRNIEHSWSPTFYIAHCAHYDTCETPLSDEIFLEGREFQHYEFTLECILSKGLIKSVLRCYDWISSLVEPMIFYWSRLSHISPTLR